MDDELDLDTLESLVIDDPAEGVRLARKTPPPADPDRRARFLGDLGNGLRLMSELGEAEAAFAEARTLPCEPFTRAEIATKSALLRWRLRQWDAAHAEADDAVSTHRAAGPDGLEGPPDRGLPAALVVRGTVALSHVRHGDRSLSCWS